MIDPTTWTPLGEGEDFWAFEQEGLVLRLPKRLEIAEHLVVERALLARIAPLAGALGIRVPIPLAGELPYIVYPKIPGLPADRVPEARSGDIARGLAATVGLLLSVLHAVPREEALSAGVPLLADQYRPSVRIDFVRSTVAGGPPIEHLLPERARMFLAEETGALPSGADETPLRLIHADLEAEHLLLDPTTLALVGVIDWTAAAIADPARDLAALWAFFGEPFLETVLDHYTLPIDRGLRARVRLLGRCHAIMALLEAVERDDQSLVDLARAQLVDVF